MTVARTGAEIYRNFHDGPGTGDLADAAALVKTIAEECAEDADAIRRLAAKMEASWQGEAAGAARRGAAPLDTEHQSAAAGLADVEMVATAEVDFFGSAKNSVVPVPAKPDAPSSWAEFFEQHETYESQVDEQNAAAKHNVAVMDGYASDSASVSQQLPREFGAFPFGPADVSVGPEGAGEDGSVSATEWRRSGGESTPGESASGDTAAGGLGAQSGPGGAPTTPDSYVPSSPGPVVPPGGDLGPAPRPTPGPSLVVPWGGMDAGRGEVGRGETSGRGEVGGRDRTGGRGEVGGRGGTGGRGEAGGRGGLLGAVPRDGGLPREGAPRGVVSEPHSAGRSGAAVIGGRGVSGAVPLGASGRGRDEEDREHRRPAFLEGDDPEDLFGSEVLTAPATIGDEDED